MQNAQEKKKTSEAHIRATNKYANSKWRPNIFIEATKRKDIENHFASRGFRSFNEYVIYLINQDMSNGK